MSSLLQQSHLAGSSSLLCSYVCRSLGCELHLSDCCLGTEEAAGLGYLTLSTAEVESVAHTPLWNAASHQQLCSWEDSGYSSSNVGGLLTFALIQTPGQHPPAHPPRHHMLLQVKRSNHAQRKVSARSKDRKLDSALDDQFSTGRLFACISSRPGQCGRADGYILEGRELEFYQRRMQRRKAKTQGASGV